MNELIRLRELSFDAINLLEMSLYVTVFLFSHETCFSFVKRNYTMRQSGRSATSLDTVRFIAEKVLSFSLMVLGGDGKSHGTRSAIRRSSWESSNSCRLGTQKWVFNAALPSSHTG